MLALPCEEGCEAGRASGLELCLDILDDQEGKETERLQREELKKYLFMFHFFKRPCLIHYCVFQFSILFPIPTFSFQKLNTRFFILVVA